MIKKLILFCTFAIFMLAVGGPVSAAPSSCDPNFCDQDGDDYFMVHKRCPAECFGSDGPDCDDSNDQIPEPEACPGVVSDVENKGGGGVFLSVVFRDHFTGGGKTGEPLVRVDKFGSDGFALDPPVEVDYINDVGSVSAHIGKFRFGLNVGLYGTRHFFLDFDCVAGPCTHPVLPFDLTTGWNVFATSPDGAQYLKMSAYEPGTDDDDSQLVNFQLEFGDDLGQGWRIMFNPDECPGVEPGDMVTVTKTSDSPDIWEFEATADKYACLQYREGPRKNHFIAGLYSLPFRITAVAIE